MARCCKHWSPSAPIFIKATNFPFSLAWYTVCLNVGLFKIFYGETATRPISITCFCGKISAHFSRSVLTYFVRFLLKNVTVSLNIRFLKQRRSVLRRQNICLGGLTISILSFCYPACNWLCASEIILEHSTDFHIYKIWCQRHVNGGHLASVSF